MSSRKNCKFCRHCGSSLEKNFKFCPQCGEITYPSAEGCGPSSGNVETSGNTNTNNSNKSGKANSTSSSTTTRLKLKSLKDFKREKEKERSSFFVRRKGGKRAKVSESDVTITIGINANGAVKRGESIPLKVLPSSTSEMIRNAAVQKQAAFNKRFNPKHEHSLVFKDGSEVVSVPGTEPPEPFTLGRYKEVSGYGYSRITLYLVPSITKKLNDLEEIICETESDSTSDDDLPTYIPTVSSRDTTIPEVNIPTSAPSTSTMPDPEASISSVMKVQCPLCFACFTINEVEQHADTCSASFGVITSESAVFECIEVEAHNEESDAEAGTTSSTSSLCSYISALQESSFSSGQDPIRVTVRRKMLWEDYRRARERYYHPGKLLKVTFSGEPAVDEGGPKREFFSGICSYDYTLVL